MQSDTPASTIAPVAATNTSSLTIVNHNSGIMAKPEAGQQIKDAAYSTSSPFTSAPVLT